VTPDPGELRDLEGPSATGGGLRRFWHLLWLTAVSDFRRRYAEPALGYLWIVLRPLAFYGAVYIFVTTFSNRFGGAVPNYGAFLLFNIILFNFFADAVGRSTRSLTGRGGLVRKMRLPRIALPFSMILSIGFTLFANLILAFGFIIAGGTHPMWTWLLLPVILLPLIIFTCGMALLVAGTYVRFRDMIEIFPAFQRVLFFLTPILFPLEFIPDGTLKAMEAFNPLAPIFAQARVWIFDSDAPTWFTFGYSPVQEVLPFALMVLTCVAGWFVFTREARRVAEEL
jgi:ABC-2 type transport system permease protein